MAGRLQTIIRREAAEGKALGPVAQFMDPGTPVGIVDLNIINRTGRGGRPQISQKEAKRHLEAYGGAQAMDWVMDCTRFVADTVATAEYHFENPEIPGLPNKKEKGPLGVSLPGQGVDAPPLLAKLMDQPNPYMDYIEMMELLIIDLMLVGNAYWYKWQTNDAGQPLALYRMSPSYMKVTPGAWGIQGYEYQIPNLEKMVIDDPSQVIHFKLANPHSPWYGLGLIQGAGRTADLELALTDSSASYMENHAMPSLAVTSDRRVPRDVFKKIRAQLRARTQGPRNSGELLVLEAGLKLASIAPNAQQAGYAELSRLSRDRIFAWFRMSPTLLGMLDEPGGANKIQDAQRLFDTKAARPLMNKIQRKITRELTDAWNLAYEIDYQYQMPPEDLARLAATYGAIPGVMLDEVRAFAGLGPHPDPKIGGITLNAVGGDAGTGQPGDPTRQGFPDRNLAGESGRPPKAGNTLPFPKNGSLPAGSNMIGGKALSLPDVIARLEALEIAPKTIEVPTEEDSMPETLEGLRSADGD